MVFEVRAIEILADCEEVVKEIVGLSDDLEKIEVNVSHAKKQDL